MGDELFESPASLWVNQHLLKIVIEYTIYIVSLLVKTCFKSFMLVRHFCNYKCIHIDEVEGIFY